ncbi:MAG: HAMP domain-containing histidine kinase, partial [Planctomycetes bacterium]|nr:HAMP domain-containing histidine kinase [Planctomycetota bacterium]
VNPHELLARVDVHVELKLHRDALMRSKVETGELLHVLFHDLQNPFALITSVMDILPDADGPERRQFEKMIRDSSRRGMDIIELVRNMQALEEGKLACGLENINLHSAVTESAAALKTRFEEKGVGIEIDVGEDITVLAHKTSLINSVLVNLLTNAIKFSESGATVKVSANRGDPTVLEVRDHGIGMPEDIRSHLFDTNTPTSRPGTGGEKGTGFGMPLAHKFMLHYGGNMEVQSWEEDTGGEQRGTLVRLTFTRGE